MPDPSTAVSGVARPLGGRSVAVYNPFGHPTPYAYGQDLESTTQVLSPNEEIFYHRGNLRTPHMVSWKQESMQELVKGERGSW
jgi:hypothetical protein